MPQFSDDIFIGPVFLPGPTVSGNPAPMPNGVGPMGRIFVFDVVPLTLQLAGLAALQTLGGSGNMTLTAGTGVTTTTLATGVTAYVLDTPRNITLTSTGNISARTFTVSGFDQYGQPMSEAITGPNNNTVAGAKAFKMVTQIAVNGAVATNTRAGYGDVIGLPYRVTDAGYVVRVGWNNTLAEDAGTFVAAVTTDPATTTTGDVRGTYTPSSACDGSKRLVMALALPAIASGPNATRVGAAGVTQA